MIGLGLAGADERADEIARIIESSRQWPCRGLDAFGALYSRGDPVLRPAHVQETGELNGASRLVPWTLLFAPSLYVVLHKLFRILFEHFIDLVHQ